MTLGGLALAVGVLVDEATVEIENIHSLLDSAKTSGMSRAMAVVEACRKTAIPRLLAMLCVLSVFVPSFFMAGVARQLVGDDVLARLHAALQPVIFFRPAPASPVFP